MSEAREPELSEYPTNPTLLQACDVRLTDRILGYLWDIPLRDEWECSRCGHKWMGWPGNGWLCAVLTDGRKVAA